LGVEFEIVEESWITLKEAMALTDVVMHQNAENPYRL
jgi:hypothetical protein